MILTTRPEKTAALSLIPLKENGIKATNLSCFELCMVQAQQPTWEKYQGIFFSSPQVFDFIPPNWMSQILKIPVKYAIGEKTAKLAPFKCDWLRESKSIQESTHDLPMGTSWIHLCSSQTKAQNLTLPWDNVPIYKPVLATKFKEHLLRLNWSEITHILFYSGSSVEYFFSQKQSSSLIDKKLVCIGSSAALVMSSLHHNFIEFQKNQLPNLYQYLQGS